MKKNPLISVIVPVYQVEQYLDECLQSILRQTYPHLEIILIDDGSTDRSGTLCDDYARLNPRIQVIHQTNKGLSCARNAGMDIATGDFISFIDSDDYIHPQFYEHLLEGFAEHPEVGITACQIYKIEAGVIHPLNKSWHVEQPVHHPHSHFCEEIILGKITHVTVWNKLYRVDLLKDIRFRPGRIVEDVLFMHDLSPIVKKHKTVLLCIPHSLYYYRIREGSICRGQVPLVIESIHAYEDIIRESQTINPAFAQQIKIKYHQGILSFIGAMERNKGWKEQYAATFHPLAKSIPVREILYYDVTTYSKFILLMFRLCPSLYPFLRYIKRSLINPLLRTKNHQL